VGLGCKGGFGFRVSVYGLRFTVYGFRFPQNHAKARAVGWPYAADGQSRIKPLS